MGEVFVLGIEGVINLEVLRCGCKGAVQGEVTRKIEERHLIGKTLLQDDIIDSVVVVPSPLWKSGAVRPHHAVAEIATIHGVDQQRRLEIRSVIVGKLDRAGLRLPGAYAKGPAHCNAPVEGARTARAEVSVHAQVSGNSARPR